MQTFIHFPQVEERFKKDIASKVASILLTEAKNGARKSQDVIYDYLSSNWKERLAVIMGLSGGSIERLQRVCDVIFTKGKNYSDIGRDPKTRKKVAHFLSNSHKYQNIIPPFICNSFYLPPSWVSILRDERRIQSIVLNSLQSKYAVAIGFALEQSIVKVVQDVGAGYEKGKVEIVDNKEVDVVIPAIKKPKLLIMSSYALTTASSQSSRANEQILMYESVLRHNRRRNDNVQFVNIIDGGGWIARKNDFEKIHQNCHAIFAYQDVKSGRLKRYLKNTL